MQRTQKTFSFLQATAVVSTLAIILWSTGVLTFRSAEAANLISFSDVISDSAPDTAANHTLTFTTSQGLSAGKNMVISFDPAFSTLNIGAITYEDIELEVDGIPQTLATNASGVTWGVGASGVDITFTSDAAVISPDDTVIIRIGTHTASGTRQIINPATPNSYTVRVNLDDEDTGETRIMVLSPVLVTAAVETIFSFTVSGVDEAEEVNTLSTTGSSESDSIDFEALVDGTEKVMAQDLRVETNAKEGFSISLVADQQLTSSNGATIDGFKNGVPITDIANADSWESPSAIIGSPDTYGHWGFTAETSDLGFGTSPAFVAVPVATPLTFFSHNGPTDGTGPEGSVRVGYQVEISALQEAANDYNATITYVATPVF